MLYKHDGTPYRSAYTRNGSKAKRATAATLDSYGETALTNAKNAISRVDPTGTALKFAFITDLHRCGDGITYASEGIIDDRYSIRLLSRMCDDIDIAAVFCGGDIVNARSENLENIDQNMNDVLNDLDSYIPYIPIFSNVGNHDKKYAAANPLHTNAWLKQLWSPVAANGNGVTVSYIDDTNFCVDFTKHKVRIVFCNQYDAVDSNSSWYANTIHCTGNWMQGLDFEDKANWLVGVVYHGADLADYGGTFPELKTNLEAYVDGGGKGALGGIAGHLHNKKEQYIQPSLNRIHVDRAYTTESQLDSVNEYCFSVFVVDSATGVFHEVRCGRSRKIIPFCSYPSGNNGLLQNGTRSADNTYSCLYCCYGGNHVRLGEVWRSRGMNFTNLAAVWGITSNDYVTSDTDSVLFSAESGDVIKTEIIFSADSASTPNPIKIFSPQIADMVTVPKGEIAGQTVTNEITLSEDTDVTAIGMNNYGATAPSGILGFELNIYKNGVKLVRGGE